MLLNPMSDVFGEADVTGSFRILKNVHAINCRHRGIWLRGLDLNQRPSGYEPDELPGCSTPRRHYWRDAVRNQIKLNVEEWCRRRETAVNQAIRQNFDFSINPKALA